jgi:MSHA pilin protein MshC
MSADRTRFAFAPTPPSRKSGAGFTLVELIIVMLVLSILSFAALVRISDQGQNDASGFADQLASTIRFAQKAAVAQRRTVYVNVSPSTRQLWACLDTATTCAQPLASPASGPLSVTGPSDLTLTSAVTQFQFGSLGQPAAATTLTLTTSASGKSFNVLIEAVSGYVHRT